MRHRLFIGFLMIACVVSNLPNELNAHTSPFAQAISPEHEAAASRILGSLYHLNGEIKFGHRLISDKNRSEAHSVFLIASAHASRQDGQWVARQLRFLVSQAAVNQPVVVWVEHAEPAGAPHSLQELVDQFKTRTQLETNWYEELIRRPMKPEIYNFLRLIFEDAVRAEKDPVAFFKNTQDPFAQSLSREIKRLRAQGFNIEVRVEEPSFEAYLRSLEHEVFSALINYWSARNRPKETLASLAAAYQIFSESLSLRDERLSRTLRNEYARRPKDFNIVVRGIAHSKNLSGCFSALDFKIKSIVQPIQRQDLDGLPPASARHYIARYHEIPSWQSPEGREFLARQFWAINPRAKSSVSSSVFAVPHKNSEFVCKFF